MYVSKFDNLSIDFVKRLWVLRKAAVIIITFVGLYSTDGSTTLVL